MTQIKLKQKNDNELVLLSLKSHKAFAEIVKRYQEKLLRYIKRLSNLDKNQAEDILQEVFIKVYRSLNQFDQSFSFSSWIYRITHNETINFLKKESRHNHLPIQIDDKEAIQLIEILPSDINLTKEMDQKILKKRVKDWIQMLPVKYQIFVILFFIEEKSYLEISDILKTPMGTVATMISRAKKKLKFIIENNPS